MITKTAVIIDGCRTAVGSFGGSLKPLSATDLACAVLKGELDRTGIDPKEIDEVIMGQCRQSSDEPNLARIAALRVGIPETCSAQTVMRQCASGMTAVHTAVMQVMLGLSNVVLAGGSESMSNSIHYIRNARYGVGTGNTELIDAVTEAQFQSQPQEIFGHFNMGATAEKIAEVLGISREEQEAFSLASQRKAVAAIAAGRFRDEIVPVTVPQGRKKPPIIFDTDEFPKPDTSAEKMARLKPCFSIRTDDDGKVFNSSETIGTGTAATSSGRNDGASCMLIASEEAANRLGLKPMAKIIGMGTAGCDPRTMGLGPVYAIPKALENAGLTLNDIQIIELNEAFAAQALGCIKLLGLENRMDIINVCGGAIALGHPVGSSGSRIIITLMHEMKKRGLKYGLASLCIAGGMGQATVIEMCD